MSAGYAPHMGHGCERANANSEGQCTDNVQCTCSCAPCSIASRVELAKEVDAWRRKVDELSERIDKHPKRR
jgi:hypothetical protein